MRITSSGRAVIMLFGVLALVLGGCGTLSGSLHTDSLALAAPPSTAAAVDIVPAARAASDASAVPDVAASAAAPAATDAAIAPPEPTVTAAESGEPADLAAVAPPQARSPFSLISIEPLTEDSVSPLILALADSMLIAQRPPGAREPGPPLDAPVEEYDPWEPFNEAMFSFNRNLDRFVLKPVAKAYNWVVPDQVQQMIDNGFENIRVVPRVVNNLLQAKWAGAGRELARFTLNSTVGFGGLFDMAKQEWGLDKTKEDFGQTLGVWGAGPGAYLILPFLPPMTVRDGIGLAVDGALDPLSYFVPFIWERFGMKVGDTINDRSLNLELYEGVEETTVDLYTAVRNAYLQRRAKQIKE